MQLDLYPKGSHKQTSKLMKHFFDLFIQKPNFQLKKHSLIEYFLSATYI